ncbi:molybdenum cofactor guanylyltransferase [Microbacterium sp. ASV81]|uniref:NTP transferase domain-containing protein n=1 Tax=Microbacterium capsulatum TaxID=3041921 RepID=A0ABU0XJY3_9MICO|nr:NTP transferase domain-containing protein [Microbacterium sp. ASV81]MDQ4215459.1 NTP transferase domain-containing protein [Microbacterium sp. ASV81]
MSGAGVDPGTEPDPGSVTGLGAILLVGGRARRMDGAVKPLLSVGGAPLLTRALRALAHAGADPVVAVGPRLDESDVVWVREDPPFGGPVAAIAAALAHGALAATEWVLVLAGDLVHPEAVVRRLLAAPRTAEYDGVVFRAGEQPQWLAALYRVGSLRAALAELDAPEGVPCRALLGGLALHRILDEDGCTGDIDTPEDLDRARADAQMEEIS